MTSGGSSGFGGQHCLLKEKESEEDAELEGRREGVLQRGESSLAGNLDCWNLSSSPEILEEEELLGELKDYQGLLEEGEQGFDLSELQDLEGEGDVQAASPLPEGEKSPRDFDMRSYWQTDKMHEEGSIEQLEKLRGVWGPGSQEDAYPELSFDAQYGSDFSPSPEALQDPLALDKCSFASEDVDEELSQSSSLSPSPCGPPPVRAQLEMQPQSLGVDGLHSPQDQKLSLESEGSLESHRLSSLASSWQDSRRLLDFQSLEDLQHSPGADAETLPELSWVEKSGPPLEKDPSEEVAQTTQHALSSSQTEGSLWGSRRGMRMPRAQRRAGCQLEEGTQKLEADVPQGLLPKGTRLSRSLSPRRSSSQKRSGRPAFKEPHRESQSTPGARDISRYGRGRLNYPLPDLSKVEPRVKFPKDPHGYHPPQGKSSPASSKEVRKPMIFKSPAEIVREVLLSSGEGSPQKCPAPTVSVIPEELKSPRQATELVHQLQEDYHKLLTKYAEAENTIDRLRLSAKVRLYSDPPKPSQGVEMGRISEASKVVTFSIPQIRTAEITRKPSQAPKGAQGEGFSGQETQHLSFCDFTNTDASGTSSPPPRKTPFLGDHLTQLLAAQTSKFQTQMEFLEELIQADRLEALEQLKGVARLKEAQQALEQAYLQARNKYQQLQNQTEPTETLGEFDPNRVVEGNIFHLGMRLEALKERIQQSTWNQRVGPDSSSPLVVTSHSCFPVQISEEQMGSPTPSLQAPVPALCTPYPETSTPRRSFTDVQLEGDVSFISDGSGEEEGDFLGLPQPCKHQEDDDFGQLLDQCSSFKSLPEALSHKHNASSEELGSAAAGTKGGSLQKPSAANKKTPPTSKELQKKEAPELPLRKVQQPAHRTRRVSSIQAEAALCEAAETDSPSVAVLRMSSRRQQAQLSPHSSMASVAGSIASEPAAPNLARKMNAALPEQDLRIVSPETDSGFVGSEASRVSPLAQMSKHKLSKMRSHRIQRASATLDAPPSSPSLKKAPGAVKRLGPDKSPGQERPESGRRRQPLARRTPFQKNLPCRWTKEMEPEGNKNSHTDSETETEAHGGISLGGTPPSHRRHPPSSSTTSLNLAQAHDNFVDSRLERDKAIAALQHEVSQLRQSLEGTLHHPYPMHASSPHPSRVQGRAPLSPSVTPAGTSGKSVVDSDQSFLVTEPKDLSESDDAPSKSQSRRQHAVSKIKPSKQSAIQGPYTGTRYPISIPESREPKTLQTSARCLGCQNLKLHHGETPASHLDDKETKGYDSPRDGSRPSKPRATEGQLCPLCKDSAKSGSKDDGAGDRKQNAPEGSSRTQQKLNHQQQPKQTGLWYLAVPSAATSLNYIPTIPLAPYPLSSVIYSPFSTTSTCSSVALPASDLGRQRATERKTSWQHPQDYHCCSRTFSCTHLENLNWSLSRAVEAAKDLKFTTQQMSKSLSWALRKARSPRASCLF